MPTNILSQDVNQDNSETLESKTLFDVMVIDSSCLDNQLTCEGWRPNNLIEYFGADWCEPCEEVEKSLELLDHQENLLIQHHPSVNDESYLNYSNFRYEDKLRLIFIPSLVLNLNGLLTGSTQSMELENILSQSNQNFSGINSLKISNDTLIWDSELEIPLKIWKTENVAHEFDNRTLPYLATDMFEVNNSQPEVNLSNWLANWSGRLIFTLEQPGLIKLRSLSQNPPGEISLNDEEQLSDTFFTIDGTPTLALIVFVLLLVMLFPALIMFRKLQLKISDEDE